MILVLIVSFPLDPTNKDSGGDRRQRDNLCRFAFYVVPGLPLPKTVCLAGGGRPLGSYPANYR